MKLSPGALSKKSLAATCALAAILAGLSSPAMAGPPPPAPAQAPRPGTAEAFQCLIRQGPKGCEKMFVGFANAASQHWVWPDNQRDFERGPFISGGYWGRADPANSFDSDVLVRQPTNDMDIYGVKFAHQEWTFYIGAAREDGRINALAIRLYSPHDLNQLRS